MVKNDNYLLSDFLYTVRTVDQTIIIHVKEAEKTGWRAILQPAPQWYKKPSVMDKYIL